MGRDLGCPCPLGGAVLELIEPRWQQLLPTGCLTELLDRWQEPHRHYHGLKHLKTGLQLLEQLVAGRLEFIAFWFHDAVHTNTSPQDETASAELAHRLLTGWLPAEQVAEVARLVMLTATHTPEPDDEAGARISDADLGALAEPWPQYCGNVAGIRAELPGLSAEQWRRGRAEFLTGFLKRDQLYYTEHGHCHWEQAASQNLSRELRELTTE